MRIIAAGTYDPEFARNRRLFTMLDAAGHDVERCQVDLWGGDRFDIPNQRKSTTLLNAIAAYPKLIVRFMRCPKADLVLVLYPGWFDMFIISILARLRRMPVVFDIFIGLFDTVVSDRQLVSARHPVGRLCRLADWLSIRLATRVIADTPAHADFFAASAGVSRDRIGVVWLGAQDDVFGPKPELRPVPGRILFHGTFIRLQGIETIIRAAKLLDDDDVELRIVGSGQEQPMVDSLLAELQPANVKLIGRVPLDAVPEEIAQASVCLGIFGTSGKASRVVPNKLYECLAVGRPVITSDTPAIRSAFAPSEVSMVPVGDPVALAAEIRRLLADHDAREAIAAAGHAKYVETFSDAPLSALLEAELRSVLG